MFIMASLPAGSTQQGQPEGLDRVDWSDRLHAPHQPRRSAL